MVTRQSTKIFRQKKLAKYSLTSSHPPDSPLQFHFIPSPLHLSLTESPIPQFCHPHINSQCSADPSHNIRTHTSSPAPNVHRSMLPSPSHRKDLGPPHPTLTPHVWGRGGGTRGSCNVSDEPLMGEIRPDLGPSVNTELCTIVCSQTKIQLKAPLGRF